MTLVPPTSGPLGHLEIFEVYFEHDGPKVFAARSYQTAEIYIGICVDEDETSDTFLYVKVPWRRFNLIRGGRLSLRDAFTVAGVDDIWRVVANYEDLANPQNEITSVALVSLSDDELPTQRASLNLDVSDLQPFEESELRDWADDENRTLVAIELDTEERQAGEFPLKDLSRIGKDLQATLDALGQEQSGSPTASGLVPGEVTREVEMSIVGLRAASFVLVLGAEPRPQLFSEGTVLAGTLERFNKLVESSEDVQELLGELSQYGRRVRSRFRELLDSLHESGTGLSVYSQFPRAEISKSSVSRGRIRRALEAIDSVRPVVEPVVLARVSLMALNITRHTFEVVDVNLNRRYSGSFAVESLARVNGLRVGVDQYYRVTLDMETDFAGAEENRPQRYTLVEIDPVDAR